MIFFDYSLSGKPELEKHDVIGPIFMNTNSSRELDKKNSQKLIQN